MIGIFCGNWQEKLKDWEHFYTSSSALSLMGNMWVSNPFWKDIGCLSVSSFYPQFPALQESRMQGAIFGPHPEKFHHLLLPTLPQSCCSRSGVMMRAGGGCLKMGGGTGWRTVGRKKIRRKPQLKNGKEIKVFPSEKWKSWIIIFFSKMIKPF